MTISGPGPSTQIAGLSAQMLDHQSLFDRLEKGHGLITGNSRLARVLNSQYKQWRVGRGDRHWQSPQIYSWSVWLDTLWECAALQGMAGTDRAVPSGAQLVSLWESAFSNTPLAHELLRPAALVDQLIETRKLIVEWQLDVNDRAWFVSDNENHAAFFQWNRAFEKQCEMGRWISPEDRTERLIKAINNSLALPTGNIDLLGFDEVSPAQAALLEALINNGHPVCRLSIAPCPKDAVLLKCRDTKDELQQVARRVRYWYEKDPGARIAIVVPDLQNRRREVERQLAEILTPADQQTTTHARPWNISMGMPLVRVPMIETAFDLLKLLDQQIDIQDIGRVLRSPWLSGARSERNSRALLEKCLRDKYPRQLRLGEVRYRAAQIKKHDRRHGELPEDQHKPQAWNSPALSGVLDTLARFESKNRGPQPASAWAESFDQLLASLGWPFADEAENDTPAMERGHNWQALQSWRDGLRELASLDTTVARLGRQEAINTLKKICVKKIFQPRTAPKSIQVLGLYEISGLRFDHLWVIGLHNDSWPATARPNPFIPGSLQIQAQCPNSSPQRELEVARTITARLLKTAPDIVFSYPGQHDGEKVLPSPLLINAEIQEVAGLPGWQQDDWRNTVAASRGPQIGPLAVPGKPALGTASGGSSILKHQALCPFRAFAVNRLGAEGLETPVDGISAMLHGSLVHRVLELFWKETRSQTSLLQMDEASLAERVHKHVDHVTRQEKSLGQRQVFRGVEAGRVYRHVMAYLEMEKQRGAFEVTGFEQEILHEIEGLPVRLFIDRVDQLPTGEKVIIDYKTGTVAPKKWFGERPEDPQLPLYAISAEQTPAGVVFGIVRDDDCGYKGVVRRDGLFPGLPPKENNSTRVLVEAGRHMPETIDNWRQVLHRLVSAFLAGEAYVDPKDGNTTCDGSYCELQSLCRVGELEQFRKAGREASA